MAGQAAVTLKALFDGTAATQGLGKVTERIRDVTKEARKQSGITGQYMRLQGAVTGLVSTYAALGAAAVGVGAAVWDSVRAFSESEAVTIRLKQAVENSGASWGAMGEEIQAQISAASKLAAVDDEVLGSALARLVQQTNNVGASQELLTIAMDVSRATGKDLETVAVALGKVYNGNTGAAKKLGIAVSEGATATEALGQIQERYKGSAEAYGQSTAAAGDRLAISFGNLKESAGEFAVNGLDVPTTLNIWSRGFDALSRKDFGGWLDTIVETEAELKEEQEKLEKSTRGLSAATDAQTASAKSNILATESLTTSKTRLTEATLAQKDAETAEVDAELNALRAKQAVAEKQRALNELKKQGKQKTTEYRIAELELTQAKREATKAANELRNAEAATVGASKAAKRAADEYAAKLLKIKNSANEAAYALDRMYGKGAGQATRDAANYGGPQNRASGGIEHPVPGGRVVRVAEAGHTESIITWDPRYRARSMSILQRTAQALGMGGGSAPQINITGSRFDAQVIATIVRAQLAQANNPVPSVG